MIGTLFNVLAFIVGLAIVLIEARSRGLVTLGFSWIVLGGVVGSAIGARLSQVLASGFESATPSGKALFGGILGGWLGVEITKRVLGIRRSTGDIFALALPAAEAIGRIGCYFNACCYGRAYHGPFAVYQHGEWRFPSQLLSSLVAAGIFGVLLWRRSRASVEGTLFRDYLLLFAVTRFLLEFIRDSPTVWLGLSLMQWLCLELLAGLLIAAIARRGNLARQVETKS